MKSHKHIALIAPALGMLVVASAEYGLAAQSENGAPFQFASGMPAYDQAYEKARQVIAADVKDGKFLAGQNWAQVWTRDTSYSVELACALLHPDVSKRSEEHTSELQSLRHLVCRLLLEKKKITR